MSLMGMSKDYGFDLSKQNISLSNESGEEAPRMKVLEKGSLLEVRV